MTDDIERNLQADDADIRREAALSLKEGAGELGIEKAVSLLLKAICDKNWRVRKTSVDILFEAYPMESYINGLIDLLYIDDNAGARNSAIEALIKLGRRATPTLMAAFKTRNVDVRKFIIDVLGEIKDRMSIPLMIGALKDEDENVKASAVEHLGSLKEPSVVDALIEILKEGDTWTSYPAVEALGRIGDVRAIPYLLDALQDKALREPALRALGKIGDAGTVRHIVPYVADRTKAVQHEAVVALEALYQGGATEDELANALFGEFGDKAIELMLDYAGNHRHEVRVAAIMLLGLMNDSRALAALVDIAVEQEYADSVKKTMVFMGRRHPEWIPPLLECANGVNARFISTVLAEIATPDYYDVFVSLLAHDDGHVRSNAARGLANVGDHRAVQHLIESLKDQYVDVQEAAMYALGRFKTHLKVNDLSHLLRVGDFKMRRSAVTLLGAIGSEEALSSISFALKDESSDVRKAAVNALFDIRSAESMKILMLALTDEVFSIRVAAAMNLGQTRNPAYLKQLKLLISDPDDMVRVAACKAIGMLGEQDAVKALATVMDDSNGFVVATAIESMSILGGDDARIVILRALDHDDQEIVRTAIKALSRFSDVEDEILKYLSHADWATRVAAAEALRMFVHSVTVRNALEKAMYSESDTVVRSSMEKALSA